MKKKYIDRVSEPELYQMILSKICKAVDEPDDMRKKWRTDVIGIARQYHGRLIPREEFEKVMELPLKEIVSKILNS